MNNVQVRGDRDLARLDREVAVDAIYRIPTGTTVSPSGQPTTTYNVIPVRVRHFSISSYEISRLSESGLGHIDAAWKMRHAYVNDIRPDHILEVDGFLYQIIDGGASLDELGLLWTILTRRRRT